MKIRHWMLAALGAALLAACGGGGGSSYEEPRAEGSSIPQSATTSSPAATAYVRTVASAADDAGEPFVVGSATLATSDTDEPEAVN